MKSPGGYRGLANLFVYVNNNNNNNNIKYIIKYLLERKEKLLKESVIFIKEGEKVLYIIK